MLKPQFPLSTIVTLALLIGITSCVPASTRLNALSTETPSNCSQIDPFAKAIAKATNAATLAQQAQSPADWDLVVVRWLEAIVAMESVSVDNPKRAFAKKKVAEYSRNLNIAQQKAKISTPSLSFPSFNNPIFTEQLILYLSYISAVGTPDILIVGSSRALVGIDPQKLQQALAAKGQGRLKVFNFSINGGTAQFVDFQLRQLLTSGQLPRLIIWADGVRAFNSGRGDRTFTSLTTSPGYQSIIAGNRPRLPQGLNTINTCDDIYSMSVSVIKSKSTDKIATGGNIPDIEAINLSEFTEQKYDQFTPNSDEILIASNPNNYSSEAIDANGFLPLENKFDPRIYYQRNPRVSGRYDGDYQPFSFNGQQTVAFDRIKSFLAEKQIPLIIVNLPLTRDYLDSVRQSREQQFRQFMERQANNGEFGFIDLAEIWKTQNQYFIDPSHLNRYGAAAIANLLAAQSSIPWPQGTQ